MSASNDRAVVSLGRAEALVLFEMLAGFHRQPILEIRHPAERMALIRLFGALQTALVEPFLPDYKALLEAARSELGAQQGEQ